MIFHKQIVLFLFYIFFMLNAAKKKQQKGGFKRKHTNRTKIKKEKQTNKNG